MKRIVFQNLSLVFCLPLVLGVILTTAIESFAAEELAISIGSSTWSAKEAQSHDLSPQALKNGQSQFSVSSSAGDTHQINLSEKQIEDILAGSTVVVSTENGEKKVKIEPKKKKAVKSGW